MPANYLRVITLSIIIWVIQQSSYLWTNVMPQSLYYDRILTMTSWKINHLEGPLQGLKKYVNRCVMRLNVEISPT